MSLFSSTKKATILGIAMALCIANMAWASTVTEIAAYINDIAGPNLSALVNGSTVTVTGTLGATPSNSDYLTLNIDDGVTVQWQATLQGTPSGSYSLINISGGSGTFEVQSGGNIENTGNGRAITNNSTCTVKISGGSVKAAGYYYVIYNSYTGIITISSGTVSATNGNGISGGTVTVSGGTVSATTGTAISGNTVTVSGGTVSTTTGTAIFGNTVTVSGGTISATDGRAISGSGKATVSGNAIITSANASGQGGTIYSVSELNINGGTIENTGTGEAVYGGTINVSSGTVKAENSHAIYGGTVNISGGTVSTSSGKAAVYEGTVKITGGTISTTQINGYAVYISSYYSITIGKSPTITGRIFTYPENLEVLTSGTDIFAPEEKTYILDFPADQYAASKIAVMNGRGFIDNFKLYNSDYALSIAGAHLAIIAKTPEEICLDDGNVWIDEECKIEDTPILPPQIASSNIHAYTIGNNIVLQNLPSNVKVEVFGLNGKHIYSAHPVHPLIEGIGVWTIDVHAKGMYIVKVSSGSEKKTVKVAVR